MIIKICKLVNYKFVTLYHEISGEIVFTKESVCHCLWMMFNDKEENKVNWFNKLNVQL